MRNTEPTNTEGPQARPHITYLNIKETYRDEFEQNALTHFATVS